LTFIAAPIAGEVPSVEPIIVNCPCIAPATFRQQISKVFAEMLLLLPLTLGILIRKYSVSKSSDKSLFLNIYCIIIVSLFFMMALGY
jgi:hypothetical protein